MDTGGQYSLMSFIDDLDDVMGAIRANLWTILNWGRMIDKLEGGASMQSVLEGLEEWIRRNFMQLNKGKCKFLYGGRNSFMQQ